MGRHIDTKNGTAKHVHFFIESHQQGKGVGTAVLRSSAQSYQRAGIKTIKLDAAEAGRYVWPKMGFRPPARTERSLVSGFKSWASKRGIKVPARVKTAPDIARYTSKGDKIGKEYLLNHSGRELVKGYSATPATVLKNIGR